MKNVTNKLYVLSEWIMNLFLLQIYWVVGTLAGGVILGVTPSSIALFATIRKLYRGSQGVNVLKHFIKEYKKNFKDSLLIGFWYLLLMTVGYVYSLFLSFTTNSWLAYTHLFMYFILLVVLVFSLYLIPVFVHYKIENKHLIPSTFIIVLNSIKWHLPLLLSLLALALIFMQYAVIFLFFGISLPAFVIFYFSSRAFKEYDIQREEA